MMVATPTRRPGEAAFAILLLAGSTFLLWTAYGISGFEALSAPGAVPLAASATMVIASAMIAATVLRQQPVPGERLAQAILPLPVVITIALVTVYAFLLEPLGFVPTSFLFLLVLIRLLSRRGLLFCMAVSAGGVAIIYFVFRVVFTVILPEGIVPEREIIAAIGRLFGGAR